MRCICKYSLFRSFFCITVPLTACDKDTTDVKKSYNWQSIFLFTIKTITKIWEYFNPTVLEAPKWCFFPFFFYKNCYWSLPNKDYVTVAIITILQSYYIAHISYHCLVFGEHKADILRKSIYHFLMGYLLKKLLYLQTNSSFLLVSTYD